jgi:hypothetical protein
MNVYVRQYPAVPAQDCAAIKDELDKAKDVYLKLIAPGVRSVYDSDGSRIEYTTGNVEAYRDVVALLQARYDACIAGRPQALTTPINFIYP